MNHFSSKNNFQSEQVFENPDEFGDVHYRDFIQTYGDGFYFNYSLHIYGSSTIYAFHDLKWRTELFHELFSEFIAPETICFGEDLFGNQFVFYPEGVGFFMIETGEIEFIGKDFNDWLEKINESPDYYSGESLMLEWTQEHKIALSEILTPKIPFVLGGKLEIDNLYNSNYEKILRFNADLAKQLKDLPDGEVISFEIS